MTSFKVDFDRYSSSCVSLEVEKEWALYGEQDRGAAFITSQAAVIPFQVYIAW